MREYKRPDTTVSGLLFMCIKEERKERIYSNIFIVLLGYYREREEKWII